MSQTIHVDLVISLVYGEVKTIGSIDLNVQEAWAREVISSQWWLSF
jgi:hypothetical protein